MTVGTTHYNNVGLHSPSGKCVGTEFYLHPELENYLPPWLTTYFSASFTTLFHHISCFITGYILAGFYCVHYVCCCIYARVVNLAAEAWM